MKFDAPSPLKTGPDASPELVHALRALRDGYGDQARIARVAEKLGPLLDAPPPATSFTQWLSQTAFKSLTAKLAASALVVGTATTWLARSAPAHEAGDLQAQRTQAPPNAHSAPTPLLPVSLPVPVPETDQAPPPVPARLPQPTPAADPKPHSRPGRVQSREGNAGPVQTIRVRGLSVDLTNAPESQPGTDDPAEAIPEEASAAPVATPEAPLQPPSAAPLPSEVDLLFEARKQLQIDAGASLRLLDEHAARFPQGMLAPEREVLAVKALRKLGRNAAAEQRLARFRAEYPDSLHLRP